MATNFLIAYGITMRIEAGYANDPNDHGGETYNGIARNSNPRWQGWTVIDSYKNQPNFPANLKNATTLPGLVQSYYQANYWSVNRLGELTDQSLANELFDIDVNMGVGTGARFLQRALNLSSDNGKKYPQITVDGQIGQATLDTYNNHAAHWEVLKIVGALQGADYIAIVERDPSQAEFLASWMSRWSIFPTTQP